MHGASYLELADYLEAGLWSLIALGFVAYALRSKGREARRCVLAAVAFLLFGASDLVEVQTGAWWHPWWLLVWKALCIASLLVLLAQYVRRKHSSC